MRPSAAVLRSVLPDSFVLVPIITGGRDVPILKLIDSRTLYYRSGVT
jgi:hypothetical protein